MSNKRDLLLSILKREKEIAKRNNKSIYILTDKDKAKIEKGL